MGTNGKAGRWKRERRHNLIHHFTPHNASIYTSLARLLSLQTLFLLQIAALLQACGLAGNAAVCGSLAAILYSESLTFLLVFSAETQKLDTHDGSSDPLQRTNASRSTLAISQLSAQH